MKKLEIINIENYNYQLNDENDKAYNFALEFHNIENPKIGDYIYMNEKLLDKNYAGYSNMYAFGPLNGIYGKKIQNINDEDIIAIVDKEKKTYLKRYYG